MASRMPAPSAMLLTAALAALVGCNAIAGIHDPVTDAQAPDSGGTDAGPPTDPAQFIGYWETPAGVQTFPDCSLQIPPDTGYHAIVVRAGASKARTSMLAFTPVDVTTGEETACVIEAEIEGAVAVVKKNQECAFVDTTNGAKFTYTYTTQTTFALDAKTADTADANIRAKVYFERQNTTCDFSEVAQYTRAASAP